MTKKPRLSKTIIGELHERCCSRFNNATTLKLLGDLKETRNIDFEIPCLYNSLVQAFLAQNDTCESRSAQNWRYKVQPKMANHNTGEKVLEKMVARRNPDQWVNQVPVASGVFSSSADRKRAIDLVHCVGDGAYEFIELKTEMGTNNPVYAAQEILLYGVVYAFYRNCASKQDVSNEGKQLLSAKSITLVVAAPKGYYTNYTNLGCFEKCLARQLAEFSAKVLPGVHMTFRFDFFDYCDPQGTQNKNVALFLERQPCFTNGESAA